MSAKSRILDALGESRLTLPALVARALAANDRAKYYFSVLQFAAAHAERPPEERPNLRRERIAAGEERAAFDALIGAARRSSGAAVRIPGVAALFEALATALEEMVAPLRVAGDPQAAQFDARRRALLAERWCDAEERLAVAAIERLAGASREAGDSPHLLVMELHKALNRLQAELATEAIEGARTYGLAPEDRSLVAAFARGVRRTSPLRFDHPGLETTATRAGDRLVIQNDIGTTDAHVIVISVRGRAATLTYSDVHLSKLVFFQSLLGGWPIVWGDTRSRSDAAFADGLYHVAVGTYEAPDDGALARYLELLGSRLVFLIDWNRARKRLRLLLRKKDALALLKWAADEEIGHMGFLKAGGEALVFEALASIGKTAGGFGARLDDLLGREAAIGYLRFVFRAATDALREGRPMALLLDQIRAELLGSLLSVREQALDHAGAQAGFAIEIAGALRDSLLGGGAPAAVVAQRAKDWESKADELVNAARDLERRNESVRELARLVERGDDAVDALEDAAFHYSLLGAEAPPAAVREPLVRLAQLSLEAAQEYLKAIECARDLGRGAARTEVQEFLQAVHRIVSLEQDGDQAERAVHSALARERVAAPGLFVVAELARALESASDALMHSALALRDHALASVIAQ